MLQANTVEWMLLHTLRKIQLKDQIIATMIAGRWPDSLKPTSSIVLQSEWICTGISIFKSRPLCNYTMEIPNFRDWANYSQ